MLIESIEHAEADVTERFLVEWRVEGDRILSSLESAFAVDGELLGATERAAIEQKVAGLKKAMDGDDYLAIKAWIESVDEATKPFAERRMDKHIKLAMAGHRVDEFADEPRAGGAGPAEAEGED